MVTPKRKPRVLIVEDYENRRELMVQILGDKVEVIEAESIGDAKLAFNEYDGEFDAIIMDAYMEVGDCMTYDLVREIRNAGYTGPMITASSAEEYNGWLMSAGCSHQSSKSQAPYKVLEVLGLAA